MNNTMEALQLLERIRKRYEHLYKPAVWAATISHAVAVKKHLDSSILTTIDVYSKRQRNEPNNSSDLVFRMCQAFIAHAAGFTDRNQWTELLNKQEGY